MAQREGSSSSQPMGSVLEQAMWVLFDALVPMLQVRLGTKCRRDASVARYQHGVSEYVRYDDGGAPLRAAATCG